MDVCTVLLLLGQALVLSEYSPRPAGSEGEWVELYNPGPAPASSAGWTLHDGTGTPRVLPEFGLPPGEYVVLAQRPDSLRAHFVLADSVRVLKPASWPVLNDRDGSGGKPADVLVLVHRSGLVDSTAYFESALPVPGRSLERVSLDRPAFEASNWGWSVDPSLATPGRTNSLSPGKADPGARFWGPRRVSPLREPAVFDYSAPGPGMVALWLVSREGTQVQLLAAPAAGPARGRLVWPPGIAPETWGPCYLCLEWRGEGRALKTCRSVWLSR